MVRAIAGVSLAVMPGEFVVVIGPSGSGKSTLLQIMGGLDIPDAGEVYIGARRLSDLNDDALTLLRRRAIGFVFQFFNLLPSLSAEENVALPLLLDGYPPRKARPRVEHVLQRVGLYHRRSHRPNELSGGEMQRVAIARALVTDPVVVLADEPTGNLDSKNSAAVLELFRKAVDELGQTIVMVSHDPAASACGSRIVALRDGVIVADSPEYPACGA
jgi:putative ABC transport system ATP-binding protein